MADTARDQVARLLRLVPYLHGRQGVRLDDAATVLGVSRRQVLADLKVLLMCGLPDGYPDDLIDVDLDALEGEGADGVIRVSNADYLSRPLRLTATEASALIVALRALQAAADDSTREVVERTVLKLEAAAESATPAGGPAVVTPEPPPAPTADVRHIVEQALDLGRELRLRYYVPSRDEESDRVVDPRALTVHEGVAYLDAWCHLAEGPRLFRLDRMLGAEVLATRVSADRGEPRDLAAGLFASAADAPHVTLRLAAAARWVAEYYPVAHVRDLGPDGLEVELVVVDEHWLDRLLLRVAPHARVVAPDRLAREFTARHAALLGETLSRYQGGGVPWPQIHAQTDTRTTGDKDE